jgi:hypothetical protein
VLFWFSGRQLLILHDVAPFWFLLIPSLATLGMYGILHMQPRYIGGFLVVIFTCLFFSLKLPSTPEARRLISGVALLLLLMLFVSRLQLGPEHVLTHTNILSFRNPNAEVVEGLQAMGLRPGDAIASLELTYNPDGDYVGPAFLASLGRFRLVAEVFFAPEPIGADLIPFHREMLDNNFWDTDTERQKKVIDALAKTGARLVVSTQVPRGPGAAGWRKIGDADYYVRWLEPVSAAGG